MSSELISSVSGSTATTTAMELDLVGSLDETDHKNPQAVTPTKIPVFFADGSRAPVALTRKACEISPFFRGLLDDPDCHEIHLKTTALHSKLTNEVLRWMEYHEDHPVVIPKKPLSSTNLADLVPEWDAKFADRDSMDDVFEVILAANYLQVTPLVELMSAQVASKLKGRTPDEIMKTFNIDRKPTPEEEAEIKRTFPDLFEDGVVAPAPKA